MRFPFVRRDGVQSKLLTKKTASAYGTLFKGKRLRLRSLQVSHSAHCLSCLASTSQSQAPDSWLWVCESPGA